MTTKNATRGTTELAPIMSNSIVVRTAERYMVDPTKLLTTLKHTCFRVKEGEVSDEQMLALLIVAEQYKLNPFTKEIFAFPDKTGIVPVVSVDGWTRIINESRELNGIQFAYADELAELDEDAKPCPAWCEVSIFRHDREHPIVVREYADEVYRPAFTGTRKDGTHFKTMGPWQTHTKRMLRHKTLIQGSRVAFGFAGIYDEDEAHRIIEASVLDAPADKPVGKPHVRVPHAKVPEAIPAEYATANTAPSDGTDQHAEHKEFIEEMEAHTARVESEVNNDLP